MTVQWVMFRRYGGQTSYTLHAIPTESKVRPKALCGAGNSMHTSIVYTTIDLPKCVRCTRLAMTDKGDQENRLQLRN